MERILYLAVAFAAGCGPICETACGLVSDTSSCEVLRSQEDEALSEFEIKVAHWNREWTCPRLSGFFVESDPGIGDAILGYTDCANRRIVTVNEEWATNAFAHEMAHAIEGCLGPPIVPVWHYGWEIRGINAAVNNTILD